MLQITIHSNSIRYNWESTFKDREVTDVLMLPSSQPSGAIPKREQSELRKRLLLTAAKSKVPYFSETAKSISMPWIRLAASVCLYKSWYMLAVFHPLWGKRWNGRSGWWSKNVCSLLVSIGSPYTQVSVVPMKPCSAIVPVFFFSDPNHQDFARLSPLRSI